MHPTLTDLLGTLADFMRAHLPSIAIGIISTVLVLYGSALNKRILRATRPLPFLGRFVLFVLLCSFGYGLVSSQLVKLLRNLLATLPDLHLVLGVSLTFIILGILAKNAREV